MIASMPREKRAMILFLGLLELDVEEGLMVVGGHFKELSSTGWDTFNALVASGEPYPSDEETWEILWDLGIATLLTPKGVAVRANA